MSKCNLQLHLCNILCLLSVNTPNKSVDINVVFFIYITKKNASQNWSASALTILTDFPSGRLEGSEKEGRCGGKRERWGFYREGGGKEAGSKIACWPYRDFYAKKGCPLYRGRTFRPLGGTGSMKKPSAHFTGCVQQLCSSLSLPESFALKENTVDITFVH